MKKILTLTIAIIFAANFANAATLNGGKHINAAHVKTTKTVKFVKISAKEFSIKKMQDTKDILMQLPESTQGNG